MSGDKRIVLLVEDKPDDEELTRLAFRECKFTGELVVVRDGQEALDYLFTAGKYPAKDVHDMPQLVLLDLKLPKMNGLEVLRRVRANTATRCLPIVVLTSSKEKQDLIDSYLLGANSYTQKPVDFNHFTDAISQIIRYWLTLNEAPIARHK
ncbi:MAG TPA: response regulator [Gallionella sp.]|nr:response regulator [Gallionella sp.]